MRSRTLERLRMPISLKFPEPFSADISDASSTKSPIPNKLQGNRFSILTYPIVIKLIVSVFVFSKLLVTSKRWLLIRYIVYLN